MKWEAHIRLMSFKKGLRNPKLIKFRVGVVEAAHELEALDVAMKIAFKDTEWDELDAADIHFIAQSFTVRRIKRASRGKGSVSKRISRGRNDPRRTSRRKSHAADTADHDAQLSSGHQRGPDREGSGGITEGAPSDSADVHEVRRIA